MFGTRVSEALKSKRAAGSRAWLPWVLATVQASYVVCNVPCLDSKNLMADTSSGRQTNDLLFLLRMVSMKSQGN